MRHRRAPCVIDGLDSAFPRGGGASRERGATDGRVDAPARHRLRDFLGVAMPGFVPESFSRTLCIYADAVSADRVTSWIL